MKDKLKVLLVSPVGDEINGGIAKWTEHIMSYYKDHIDNIELVLLYNTRAKASFGTFSLFQRILNGIRNYYPLYKDFKKIVKSNKIDVAHICTSASISLLKDIAIAKYARKKGVHTVVHCHFGRIPNILNSSNWENKLFLKLLKIVDGIIVIDLQSFMALKDFGYDKVSYLPNPLAITVQKIIEENSPIERQPNKIVFAGHIVATKGVFELVEACKQIGGIQLEMLGHIPDLEIKKRLIDLSEDGEESWLHIKGVMPFEEVIKNMLSCGIFALPTYSEGFPNVIIESMACGCPIVTTPVGAIPEMLDIEGENPCGICVSPKNIDELRNALEELLKNKDKACLLANNARNRVNKMYVISKVWEQLVDIWYRN